MLISNTKGLDDAIVALLALEKKCRANNDTHTLKQLCVHMVRLCREKNDWIKLNSTVSVINKRRNQSKFAVTAVVEECLTYIEQTPSQAVKVDLIKALKEVCEGKMYLEGESARLHLMLALIYEGDGDIGAACEIIQDVHVETYGSLSKKEKAEYILQQVRLNLLRKDFVRALIHSRKMNKRTLEDKDEGFDEVKIFFYRLMVQYHLHDTNYWEICQCFYKVPLTTCLSRPPPLISFSRSTIPRPQSPTLPRWPRHWTAASRSCSSPSTTTRRTTCCTASRL